MTHDPRSHGTVLIAAAIFLAVGAGAARSEGALAIGLPEDGAQNGFAYGYATGYDDVETAKREALNTCRASKGGASRAVRRLCRIEATFHRRCVAVAMDPRDGTSGVGWAVADEQIEAEREALAACHETSQEGERLSCRIDGSGCDDASSD